MAVIKNVELWYAKLEKPNAAFNKENPTWELQIRTRDKAEAKKWKELSLNVKTADDDNGIYYSANLKKKSKKADGTDNAKVNVVSGSLDPIDPNTLGNGSVGNVRIWQREYEVAGRKGISSMLMAVQVTKLLEYKPVAREDEFEIEEFEVMAAGSLQDIDADDLF